ncbi:MAG: hypothetical protein JXR76_21110 [Deltaproteobacteria bacterium]|nr:hypothetical protein [Deltaproteobacteria bacterium]
MKHRLLAFLPMIFLLTGFCLTGCDGSSSDSSSETESDSCCDTETASEVIPTDSETDTGKTELRGPCSFENALGGLIVSVAQSFSSVSGAFADSVAPSSVPELELEDGDCSLWRRRNLSCVPSCKSGFTCDVDGNCITSPVQQDAGTITLDGLSEPVVVEPLEPTNSYSKVDFNDAAFGAGDVITMTSTGGYFGELTLHGVGVAPFAVTSLVWSIEAGSPLTVSWETTDGDVDAQIELIMNIDQHGQSPLTLICEFADTGEATVSAKLIDALINSGVSGRPSGRLTRRTVDSMDVAAGCIELEISSSLKATVQL